MLCFVPESAFGQQGGPGSAWTAGVSFESNSPAGEDTWAFDAAEMPSKDLVIVGYAETNGGNTRVPAYAVLDQYGTLKTSVRYDYSEGAGAFAQICNAPNGGSIMAGWQGPKAVLTKLDNNYSEVWRRTFDLPTNDGVERLQTVELLPSGEILLAGGFRNGSAPQGGTFFVVCDGDGYPIANKTAVFPDVNGKILDCKTVTDNNNTYVLATGFRVMNDQTFKFHIKELGDDSDLNADNTPMVGNQYLIQDWDVLVAIFNVNDITPGMSSANFKYYNSKDFDFMSFGLDEACHCVNNNPEIWDAPSCAGTYGPCTPGKSDKTPGWGVNSINGSPVIDRYFGYDGTPRPCFVSKDVGRSIVYTNGFVYVAAEMNTLEMTGSVYAGLHRDGQNGVELKGLPCPDPDDESHRYGAYKDAYIHLLKFDLNGNLAPNLPNSPNIENVAHCSGGDFYATIVADQNDGKIVLGTTTADRGLCGLPPVEECGIAEVHLLAKYDPVTLQSVWQQHYLSGAEGLTGSCAFGLIQTADGGFVIVGNNETEDANGNEDETFTIVRFTSDCLQNTAFDLGNYTVLTGLTTTWSVANMRINGLITVPSGATLVIDGITVEFAYTKNLPPDRKCGIEVQQGGKLVVKGGAVLKGLNACGGEQMWDGVIALGNPGSPQTNANQGVVEILGNSRIENALRGTVLGSAAWTTEFIDTPVGGSIGTLNFPNYFETYTQGGGKLTATNATYRNCGKGVVWNPYHKFSNLSVLTDVRFECTGALPDPLYKPYFTALGEPTSTETFCEIQANRGIVFHNCTSRNTAPGALFPNPRNKPSGILSVDGQFKVEGPSTQFQNLYVGINAGGIASGIPSAISANGAHFDNVYQNVNLVATMGTEVTGCSFSSMPNTASMQNDGAASGIFCTKASAYTLRSNTLSGNATNYGIVSRHSALNGALIEGNTLSGFNLLADLFENDNSALQTHCNTYQGTVGDASWEVSGVLKDQRDPFDLNYYPDNRFIWDCSTVNNMLDIRSTTPFTYYERTESGANANTVLKCYTPIVMKIPGNSPDPANCVIEDPCPNPPYCNSLLSIYGATNYALPNRNDLLNAYVRMSPSVVSDSLYLPAVTRAITLLTSRNQQADKRILVATYASIGDYTNAQQYLQQVTGADTETQDFVAYYTVLINGGLAGRDAYHLTSAEFGQLAPLMTHSTTVADQVKVLDHIVNGVYYPLKVDAGYGNRPGERSETEGSIAVSTSGVSVFPNPFSNEVRFVAPDGLLIDGISIMDISGRLLFERNQLSDSEFTWQPEGIPQGMLFYQCRLSNREVTHGKILYNKK